MARHAKLGLTRRQLLCYSLSGIVCRGISDECRGTLTEIAWSWPVNGVAFSAPNVIAPVFAATEIVVTFLAGVARQTSFRNLFRVFVFK